LGIEPTVSPTLLRRELAPLRRQSAAGAGLLFAAGMGLYIAGFAATLVVRELWVLVLSSAALGPLIALLFRIAHDAGHNSHFADRRWNQVIARLCILPSYHPYSIWLWLHNKSHHGFTNLRDRDYIWVPLSKTDYDRATPIGRAAERFYRSAVGVGWYYCCEIWWRKMLRRPGTARLASSKAMTYDRLSVAAFFCAQLGAIAASADSIGALITVLAAAIVVPFLVFCWMVGYVSFFNHTHPRVPWFSRAREWSFFGGQLNCTVHMSVPPWLVFFLTDLGLHGTHHFDPRIPIWRLSGAEDVVGRVFARDIVFERWTFGSQAAILRACKLYDYDAHRWLDFAGRPTTPAILGAAAAE
jgi:omega-6 fatty acid desaturase (delta-12 desaturase)